MLRRRLRSDARDARRTWHAGVSPELEVGDPSLEGRPAALSDSPGTEPSPDLSDPPVVAGRIPVAWWQLLVGVLSWVAFAAGWVRVVRMGLPDRLVLEAGALVLLTLVVITLATSWWVRHNLAIYRRKGPRRAIPATDTVITEDRLGRPLTGPLAELADVAEIVITLRGGEKWYSRA